MVGVKDILLKASPLREEVAAPYSGDAISNQEAWHALTVPAAFAFLTSSPSGLSTEQVEVRRRESGVN